MQINSNNLEAGNFRHSFVKEPNKSLVCCNKEYEKRKWNEINHWKTGKDRLTDAGQIFLLGWGFFYLPFRDSVGS